MNDLRKTKIVATIGPASSSKRVLKALIVGGVDVCRLNFSHGTHQDHKKIIEKIRTIDQEEGKNTAILADLQGPKLRIGKVANDEISLKKGAELELSTDSFVGSEKRLSVNYNELAADVNVGEKVLIDDGKITLQVLSTDKKKKVRVKVMHGGEISSRKGVNLPNTKLSLPSMTEKDHEDLKFAIKNKLDWIGLSFVRSPEDIISLRKIIEKHKSKMRIIAKIEKPEALLHIDRIIEESDGLMVARGDLGVEAALEELPLAQKMIIKKGIKSAKPVIVATQMMESMIENITPTRAEVNDVANAVLDGADAVMLSNETSVGNHPARVIEVMRKIILQGETFEGIYYHEKEPTYNHERFISDSICYNACRLANRVKAKAIVTMTHSGYTAFKIASQRPLAPIFAFTSNKAILKMLSLVWGVKVFYYNRFVSTDDTISDIKKILQNSGYVKEGDLIINTASMPIAEKGTTNMLKLSHV